jgi:hypothetical protein
MKFRQVTALCCSLFVSAFLAAAPATAANPGGLAFKYQTNVSLYGKPTGLMVTGRCNRYATEFATMRAKGGEVIAYLNATSRPDNRVCSLDQAFYMNNYGAVPLWPYPSYGQRSIWPGTKMIDMRAGSKWNLWVVSYVEKLMREKKVDGVFLDVIGARPYNQSNWTAWPQWEKDAWTNGAIDLVRRIDAKRRAINPNFIVMNNSVWSTNGTLGLAGEKYVDGVAIEGHTLNAYHLNYIKKPFSNLGHKRTFIISRSSADAKAWSATGVPTHVTYQPLDHYAYPLAPVVGFRALTDR